MNYKFSNENIYQPDEDTIYFIFNNWNDYGNCMLYSIFLKDWDFYDTGYRILVVDNNFKFQDETKLQGISSFSDLSEYKFLGFSTNLEFYDSLAQKIGSEKLNDFLETTHDITINKEKLEYIEKKLQNELSENPFYQKFDNEKEELIDNGLIREGDKPYNLANFCNKIGINFSELVANKLEAKNAPKFYNYFKRFINNEYMGDDEEYIEIKEIIYRLKNVNKFISDLEESDFVKFVSIIMDDTNYYQVISEKVPKLLEESDSDIEDDKKIFRNVLRIQDILRINDIPEHLGQYTSLATLEYLLPISKENSDSNGKIKPSTKEKSIPSLRLTNGNQLNDPMEGKVLFSYLDIDTNEYESTNNYLASTTPVKDNLPLWKQYGDNAKGVFTIFDSKSFCDSLIKKHCIYKICYLNPKNGDVFLPYSTSENNKTSEESEDDLEKCFEKDPEDEIRNSLKEIKTIMQKKLQTNENNSKILQKWRKYMDILKFLFKKVDYQYEDEYRILVNQQDLTKIEYQKIDNIPWGYKMHTYLYDEKGNKLPLKFKEIMVGPKSIQDLNYIAEIIKYCDKNITITTSKIQYR